jgi:hypothetical protein
LVPPPLEPEQGLDDQLVHPAGRAGVPAPAAALVWSAGVALQDWLKASGITSGPLFRRILENGKLGTDGPWGTAVRDIVKARCALAGVGADFSAHSLRSGFVTEAGRQNMPLQKTMAMTRPRSVEAVGGYFRAGAVQVSAVGRMMDSGRRRSDESPE